MNVLIFVMSMLMIFVVMTYARLDTYKAMTGVEGEFVRYMEAIERNYINLSADKLYDRVSFKKEKKPTKPPKDPKEVDPKKKVKSYGRISLKPLIDKKLREKNEDEYNATVDLLKILIQVLYAHQPQFQGLMLNRPTWIEEIIDRIPKVIEDLPQNVKINRIADLSNLELGDGLDEAFYLMLKGCPGSIKSTIPDEELEDNEDDSDEAEEAEAYTSDKSYDSILNFIDLHNSLKINIYLAPRPLLVAIYGDPATAEQIILRRYELFNAVDHEEMSDSEASDKLKNEFQPSIENSLLDFRVTGSDPRRYN